MIITQPSITLEREELTSLNDALELCDQIIQDCPAGQKFESFLENVENAQYFLNNLLRDYNELSSNED